MKRAFALAILLTFAAACRTQVPGTPLAGNDPLPTLRLEALMRTADQRTALRGSARLDLDAPDAKLNRPQRIALPRVL